MHHSVSIRMRMPRMGIFASANQKDYFSQRKASNTTEVGRKKPCLLAMITMKINRLAEFSSEVAEKAIKWYRSL